MSLRILAVFAVIPYTDLGLIGFYTHLCFDRLSIALSFFGKITFS
jgi:hypothetical protein